MEINNTDAEGRLVVSDGVFYARKDLKADIIVDMCTLTGAQGIATGREAQNPLFVVLLLTKDPASDSRHRILTFV